MHKVILLWYIHLRLIIVIIATLIIDDARFSNIEQTDDWSNRGNRAIRNNRKKGHSRLLNSIRISLVHTQLLKVGSHCNHTHRVLVNYPIIVETLLVNLVCLVNFVKTGNIWNSWWVCWSLCYIFKLDKTRSFYLLLVPFGIILAVSLDELKNQNCIVLTKKEKTLF